MAVTVRPLEDAARRVVNLSHIDASRPPSATHPRSGRRTSRRSAPKPVGARAKPCRSRANHRRARAREVRVLGLTLKTGILADGYLSTDRGTGSRRPAPGPCDRAAPRSRRTRYCPRQVLRVAAVHLAPVRASRTSLRASTSRCGSSGRLEDSGARRCTLWRVRRRSRAKVVRAVARTSIGNEIVHCRSAMSSQGAKGVGHHLDRQGVLHLSGSAPCAAREHLLRPVRELAVADDLDRRPVDRRDHLRPHARRAAASPRTARFRHPVVHPVADGPHGLAHCVRRQPCVRLREHGVGVRPDVELEVVGRLDARRPFVDDGVERQRTLERVQHELGHALDREFDEDAECAEPDGERAELVDCDGPTSPAAVTTFAPRMRVARPPNRRPVPCVPVEVAPASVCRSMSPRFSMASPCGRSRPGSWCRLVPAPKVTRLPSTASTPSTPDTSSSTPEVAAIAVKLWPAPTVLIVRLRSRANCTACTTSSMDVARATYAGRDSSERPQLRQRRPSRMKAGVPARTSVTGTAAPRRGRWAPSRRCGRPRRSRSRRGAR